MVEQDERKDKEISYDTTGNAIGGTAGEGIKIEIKGELNGAVVREALSLLAQYLRAKMHIQLNVNQSHPDEIGQEKDFLQHDFFTANQIKELLGQPHLLSHTASDETPLPRAPSEHTTEVNSVSVRRIFDFRRITRRGFSILSAVVVALLFGWYFSQRIDIKILSYYPSYYPKIRLEDNSLSQFASENRLSTDQIKKLKYFSDRKFDAINAINYFTFSEQLKAHPYVFNSISSNLSFQIYKEYFESLRHSVPQDYLLENLNPIIDYGVKEGYSPSQLDSLCRAFMQSRLRERIFDSIRTNSQILKTLFDHFVELRDDDIQSYLAILQDKVANYSYGGQELVAMIQKMHIMEAIRDYGKDLGGFVSKEREYRKTITQ